jgi:hypothetical protein
MSREFLVCPLCDCIPDGVASHERLAIHIAQHLKSLAFLSLSYLECDPEEQQVSNASIEPDCTNSSRASRYEPHTDDSLDDIPSTEMLGAGEIRVDAHTFLGTPELDRSTTWDGRQRKVFNGPDETLEKFMIAQQLKQARFEPAVDPPVCHVSVKTTER